ncbi:m74R [Myxoma virus]|uniref:DNA topoisomerase n=2 Tax=Myxoma virus TaxID=10273 RepID=Q9Q8M6_MYXVL|nr:DNA topoisomerase type I [Myxoma virus]ACB28869.1 m74R [recombinant virus 6918VP60-T2]AAF14962.1 m74R [Myxoma virus]ACB28697.1 m74R [Myxoma virus]ADK63714.1 m74R [Myxoma virus]AFU77006.1 m74R [Myxoma virus]
MRAFVYKDGKLYEDKELTMPVPSSNPTYEILKHVKIPSHLTNVIVYEQTYEQSLSRLIFVGLDSKGRRQYFYGKMHVQRRNSARDTIFIKVHRVIDKIHTFIDDAIKQKNDVLFQLGVFMLMETSFFIRMGKVKYLKENDTVGLLTLKHKNIVREHRKILIHFVGKDKVVHNFTVHSSNKLYKPLLRLIDRKEPDSFLFHKLSEKKVYKAVQQFGIRLKDLRTYGVNYTFLYNFWTNVKSLNPIPPIKKMISTSIKQTADIVGHTPSISKRAYIANTVLEYLTHDSELINTIKDISFDEFIQLITDYIANGQTVT